MLFDRVVAVTALLIALTGGIPTLLSVLGDRNFFEISSGGLPLFDVREGKFLVEIPLVVFNASGKPTTVFAVYPVAEDLEGRAVDSAGVSFWSNTLYQDVELPVRLQPGEKLEVLIGLFIPVVAEKEQLRSAVEGAMGALEGGIEELASIYSLGEEKGLSQDVMKAIFRNTFFPQSEQMNIQMRGNCDRIGMEIGLLSHCVTMFVHVEDQQLTKAGKFAISFFPIGET
ncbi:hypothetical protein [Roseovarius amoyensis]|uniref:hypothetical protein n=1 Tax=Roseovarius amoyensis TaxID=2211448 RepID=UPI000DBE64C6|nr:hypothetical protein [Roseovarius amoyensis]